MGDLGSVVRSGEKGTFRARDPWPSDHPGTESTDRLFGGSTLDVVESLSFIAIWCGGFYKYFSPNLDTWEFAG